MHLSYPLYNMPYCGICIVSDTIPARYLCKPCNIVLDKQVNKPSSIKRCIALFSSSLACLLRPTDDKDLSTFSIEKEKKNRE